MQAGDASGTGLFDTANRTYDSKRLGSIDSSLEDKFPQLIGPNEVGHQHTVMWSSLLIAAPLLSACEECVAGVCGLQHGDYQPPDPVFCRCCIGASNWLS